MGITKIDPVKLASDAQGFGQLGWSVAPKRFSDSRSILAHNVQSLDRMDGPYEDGRRVSIIAADAIQHPVHSIGEVNICAASFAIHHGVSRGFSAAGMAGLVLLAVISFRFQDIPGSDYVADLPDKSFAQKFAGNRLN
jgi:hypothetical protein